MKTFTSHNQSTKCEKEHFYSLQQQHWHSELLPINKLKTISSSAYRAVLTGLVALEQALRLQQRVRLALIILMVAAPLSSVAYLLFDETPHDLTRYYVNDHYLFYVLCPRIYELLNFIGIFLLFPEGKKRAYFIALPFGLTLAKIIWLCQVSTDAEFHQIVPSYFIVAATLLGTVILFTINWLTHSLYHRFDAHIARIIGLMKINIDPLQKQAMIEKELTELKNFHHQY